MKILPTPIQDCYLVDLDLLSDDRGFFSRLYCEKQFSLHGLNTSWTQVNNSFTNLAGTLRGLHFQYPPHSEVKLVRCFSGAIWDVIVDLRVNSRTYGHWFGAELSAINRRSMYVPKGCAHGFLSLNANSEILYLVSNFYSKEHEGTLLWSDESLGIEWPIKPRLISEKDRDGLRLQDIKY